MKIATYLINLDGSHERLAHASAQLQAQGIAFERISGVDGRQFNVDEHPLYRQKRAMRYMGRAVMPGELGCFLSHMKAAQTLLDSDADAAVVLEDDMNCSHNFVETLEQAVRWLEQNGHEQWQLINFGNQQMKISTPIHSFHDAGKEVVLYAAHYFPMTATGLLWSRQGAANLLESIKKEGIFAPWDNYTRHWQTRQAQGYSFWPPLVRADGFDSDIADQNIRKKHQRAPYYFLSKQSRLWRDKWHAMRAMKQLKK